jgi:hypothetical protein
MYEPCRPVALPCFPALTAGPGLVKHFALFGVEQLQSVLDHLVQVRPLAPGRSFSPCLPWMMTGCGTVP